jgi:hypothetical protein
VKGERYRRYLKHPVFLAAREIALRRANGRCACGQPATEVHHRRYSPWGMYDVPANLQPICHACHCREHNKND